MSEPDISERADGSIHVGTALTETERNEQALDRLVEDVQSDPDATATEKRLAAALVALANSQ